MNYLVASEYQTYGLDVATPSCWIAAASSMIDSHCRRATLGVAQFVERLRIGTGQHCVQLTYLPLAAPAGQTSPLISARGRYAPPRRGDNPTMWELASQVAVAFALPGTWTNLDITLMDYFAGTGEVSWLGNPLGLEFQEIEITYTAGFSVIPDPVKFACAQIVRNAQATPALNVRESLISEMHMQYFADTLLDSTVKEMLASYVAQKVA